MRVLNKLTQEKIIEYSERGRIFAEKIKNELNICMPIKIDDLFDYVLADLKKMGYKVAYDDVLKDKKLSQSIPSTTDHDTKIIKLNRNFPESERIEAIFHEYVHIKEETLPDIEDIINDKEKQYDLENLVDIINYYFIMPVDELKEVLKKRKYQLNKILWGYYKGYVKSSVLQWISINSLIPCHFAWVMLIKEGNEEFCYDNYSYDQKSDPKEFNIKEVLRNKESAAAKAVKEKKLMNNKKTIIDNEEYRCYAYYEKGLSKELCSTNLETKNIKYDRLLVIGWKKSLYENLNLE